MASSKFIMESAPGAITRINRRDDVASMGADFDPQFIDSLEKIRV